VGAGAEKHREIAVDCGKNKKNPCDGEEFLRNPAEIRRGETLLMAFTAESGFIQRVPRNGIAVNFLSPIHLTSN